MALNQEMACVYAALILQDDEVAITGDKIATLLKAANVEFEPFWPGLFAKAVEGVDVKVSVSGLMSKGTFLLGAAIEFRIEVYVKEGKVYPFWVFGSPSVPFQPSNGVILWARDISNDYRLYSY